MTPDDWYYSSVQPFTDSASDADDDDNPALKLGERARLACALYATLIGE